MEIAIGLTAAILVLFPIAGIAIGHEKGDEWADTLISALAGLWFGICASFWVWVIYVVAHFVAKFW